MKLILSHSFQFPVGFDNEVLLGLRFLVIREIRCICLFWMLLGFSYFLKSLYFQIVILWIHIFIICLSVSLIHIWYITEIKLKYFYLKLFYNFSLGSRKEKNGSHEQEGYHFFQDSTLWFKEICGNHCSVNFKSFKVMKDKKSLRN